MQYPEVETMYYVCINFYKQLNNIYNLSTNY